MFKCSIKLSFTTHNSRLLVFLSTRLRFVERCLPKSAKGIKKALCCVTRLQMAFVRQASRPCRLHGVPAGRMKALRNKRISALNVFFCFSFRVLSGSRKRHSLDLLFRFASRQNEKQTSLMCVRKLVFI